MVYFVCYEQGKNMLRQSDQSDTDLPFQSFLLASAVASTLASVAVNPLDILKVPIHSQSKTRWQVGVHTGRPSQLLQDLLKREGTLALWKGSLARILFTAPNVTITMALYEEMKKFL